LAAPLLQDASFLTPYPRPRWAEYVERGDWADNGIVDRERAYRMNERDLVNYVVGCRDESEQHRAPLEPYWDWYDQLFHLEAWDDDKHQWQTQVAIPEIRTKIRVAKSILKASLVDSPEFFKLFSYKLWEEPDVRMIQRWLQLVQEQSGLVDAYADALEEGLLYGSGCMALSLEDFTSYKPRMQDPDPQQVQQWMQQAQWAAMNGQQPPPQPMPYMVASPETRSKFIWKYKPVRDVYPDPFSEGGDVYRGKYFVEYSEADRDILEERVRVGMYDSIDDIGEPTLSRSRDVRNRYDNKTRTSRKRDGILEFQGDILDPEGKVVAREWQITVINERSVVCCAPNPLITKKRRYIWTTPIRHRNRVWGDSLVDADAHVQVAVTQMLDLMIDSAKYSVLSAFWYDTSKADEPTPPDTISPGMIVPASGGQPLGKIDFNSRANEAWPIVRELLDWGGKSTQLSEFADGSPTSRGRPSAAEVTSKTAASQQHLNNSMRDLERRDLEPALQLLMDYIVEFGGDTSDPRLSDILQEWGGPQALLDERYRLMLLTKDYKIRVHGISTMLGRDTLAQRIMQAMQLAMQFGIPLQNTIEIFYMMLGTLGIEPGQFNLPPTPDDYRMQQFMQQMQAQQAAMAGGAGPGMGGGPFQGAPSQMPSQAGQAPPTPQALMNQMQVGGPPMAA
jgi:hypothetical protein